MNWTNKDRDERTLAAENASYRWGYLFLSFGLLLVVAYRGFMHKEAAWDLLGLVVIGGAVTTAFQAYYAILSRKWAIIGLATAILSAAIAGALMWSRLTR
ncbi:MAG: hypothetical protein ACKO23_09330 [Gemmataceae bacterium]